ncbi:AraC family transcriptional regulator [Pseudomonas prosekii]|uniref:AraC family transcriptional regulator n=1 Tax=Pseudomonas prosekii TaxID=1148509 RepID=A0A3L8CI83_9PSED|nr:AraC family transcriptional regulator [Pseudomonas prosekii]RLU07976.1 AraC family transcriptional regulator [Pseudomonas prosekii]RLU11444.1 AraC family transcriptional regulator [Pseudomonas prosekii]
MVALLAKLAPDEGYNLTALPDVRLLRSNRALQRTPVLYDPGIVIVCQGRKIGYWGEATYRYDAQHYLAVAVPVPFTMETDASAEEPLLAIYLHLDFNLAAELMLLIDDLLQVDDQPTAEPKGMYASPMEPRLRQSVLRLLEALESPQESRLLGPALVREIYYRILTGAQGGSMRAALAARGQFGRISRALRTIHGSLGERLDVEQLAAQANMSVPTFHAHFKAVTHTSPMQYLKSTRLHQARLLMARNGYSVARAAAQVGYESGSQFSREFKRLFGRTPTAEVARMKDAFALPPPLEDAVFVSSH